VQRRFKNRWYGNFVDLLIKLTLLSAATGTVLTTATAVRREEIMKESTCVAGPMVRDSTILSKNGGCNLRSDKIDCVIEETSGGGNYNVSRQAVGLGIEVRPILMIGRAGLDPTVRSRVERDLGRPVQWWPCLSNNRQSILLGDKCFTVRAEVADVAIPAEVQAAVTEAEWTVVAPLMSRDFDVASALLKSAQRSILMLSNDQLSDPQACVSLMSNADVTVLNQAEIERLTGLADPRESLFRLRENGARDLVVTGRAGIMALIGKNLLWQPSYEVIARRTIGAGDVCVGSLLACLVKRRTWEDTLRFAAAACAVHVSGGNAADPVAVQAMLDPPVPTVPFRPAKRRVPARRMAQLASLAGVFMLGIGAVAWAIDSFL
jgi:sugar/nucleoside kinase (ribokinase family)